MMAVNKSSYRPSGSILEMLVRCTTASVTSCSYHNLWLVLIGLLMPPPAAESIQPPRSRASQFYCYLDFFCRGAENGTRLKLQTSHRHQLGSDKFSFHQSASVREQVSPPNRFARKEVSWQGKQIKTAARLAEC
jgi:hypothetical protein